MKKIISLIVVMLMVIGTFAACGQNEAASDAGSSAESSGEDKKISIVTTIFPVYDWTKNILGDKAKDADLTMLLDSGTDFHSYQPTAEDVMKISNCDMFIYIGGESGDWVDEALKDVTNKDMVVINLMDALGDKKKEEEVVEGMEEEDEHEGETDEQAEEGPEYDEHIWLSLKNAVILCDAIEKGLEKVDPDNADTYKANLEAYTKQLNDLDTDYASAAKNAKTKTLLFGDRFPFRYLADDYGLNYYAAFSGCSAESEASFETISFLAKKAVELGLEDILTIDDSDKKIAKTIIDNTKTKAQKVLNLDSMQSVTEKDVKEGADFIKIMKDNLSVLKEALN